MKLLKPAWVSHDGNPIFSIDIHPDGSRFATGGQGDGCGKIVIWNMSPVRYEEDEKNESIPKMLCQMDNHLACVNSVRWSHNGRSLASGGDDKLIMIWQTSRHASIGGGFGSGSNAVNVEQWRCSNTLRGHSGDVLDLAWSPDDVWLATCSIDNTIVVWNALKFPEQVAVLRGHTGLVKGVVWDPVCKYLASQSDDKTLRIWRTLDWQQEACVTEPFSECGGTTHLLRLDWSPDGHYVVSAHAMNNSGPTAQIIERNGWKTVMDFVGHRKAVTVVRFNPNILSKKLKKDSNKVKQYSCCAVGSRDRSLSIWLTALKRPLVVTHDLFTSSILDISWGPKGFEVLCCSWDGTVAYLEFSEEEIGRPSTKEEKQRLHEKTYGKSVGHGVLGNAANQIVESTAILKLQQKTNHEKSLEKEKEKANPVKQSEVKNTSLNTSTVNGGLTPVKPDSTKQIETKTADGKRRITPIFLAPQPEIGEAPLPFSTSTGPTFSSSTEKTKISIEKKDIVTAPATPVKAKEGDGLSKPHTSATKSPPVSIAALEPKTAEKNKAISSSETERTVEKDKSKLKLSAKRKLEIGPDGEPKKKKDGRGRPRKDKHLLEASQTSAATPTVIEKQVSRIVYTTSGLELPVPHIEKSLSIQIAGTVASDSAMYLQIENGVISGFTTVHRFKCMKSGTEIWENVLTSKVLAMCGNSFLASTACEDQSISIFSTASGRRLIPCMVLDSRCSELKCSGHYLMAITSKGSLFVWNVRTMAAVIENISLVPIISSNETKIQGVLLTEQGLPVLTLSNSKTFTYKVEVGCWVLLTSKESILHSCSDHLRYKPEGSAVRGEHGPLSTLQSKTQRPGSDAMKLFKTNLPLQQSSTIGHIENQLSCTLALKSGSEFHFWLQTYVRYLAQEGLENRLKELCDELLGPVYKSKNQEKWDAFILGHKKTNLLKELLPIIGSNLKLQRLYSEYQEQLDAIT